MDFTSLSFLTYVYAFIYVLFYFPINILCTPGHEAAHAKASTKNNIESILVIFIPFLKKSYKKKKSGINYYYLNKKKGCKMLDVPLHVSGVCYDNTPHKEANVLKKVVITGPIYSSIYFFFYTVFYFTISVPIIRYIAQRLYYDFWDLGFPFLLSIVLVFLFMLIFLFLPNPIEFILFKREINNCIEEKRKLNFYLSDSTSFWYANKIASLLKELSTYVSIDNDEYVRTVILCENMVKGE